MPVFPLLDSHGFTLSGLLTYFIDQEIPLNFSGSIFLKAMGFGRLRKVELLFDITENFTGEVTQALSSEEQTTSATPLIRFRDFNDWRAEYLRLNQKTEADSIGFDQFVFFKWMGRLCPEFREASSGIPLRLTKILECSDKEIFNTVEETTEIYRKLTESANEDERATQYGCLSYLSQAFLRLQRTIPANRLRTLTESQAMRLRLKCQVLHGEIMAMIVPMMGESRPGHHLAVSALTYCCQSLEQITSLINAPLDRTTSLCLALLRREPQTDHAELTEISDDEKSLSASVVAMNHLLQAGASGDLDKCSDGLSCLPLAQFTQTGRELLLDPAARIKAEQIDKYYAEMNERITRVDPIDEPVASLDVSTDPEAQEMDTLSVIEIVERPSPPQSEPPPEPTYPNLRHATVVSILVDHLAKSVPDSTPGGHLWKDWLAERKDSIVSQLLRKMDLARCSGCVAVTMAFQNAAMALILNEEEKSASTADDTYRTKNKAMAVSLSQWCAIVCEYFSYDGFALEAKMSKIASEITRLIGLDASTTLERRRSLFDSIVSNTLGLGELIAQIPSIRDHLDDTLAAYQDRIRCFTFSRISEPGSDFASIETSALAWQRLALLRTQLGWRVTAVKASAMVSWFGQFLDALTQCTRLTHEAPHQPPATFSALPELKKRLNTLLPALQRMSDWILSWPREALEAIQENYFSEGKPCYKKRHLVIEIPSDNSRKSTDVKLLDKKALARRIESAAETTPLIENEARKSECGASSSRKT